MDELHLQPSDEPDEDSQVDSSNDAHSPTPENESSDSSNVTPPSSGSPHPHSDGNDAQRQNGSDSAENATHHHSDSIISAPGRSSEDTRESDDSQTGLVRHTTTRSSRQQFESSLPNDPPPSYDIVDLSHDDRAQEDTFVGGPPGLITPGLGTDSTSPLVTSFQPRVFDSANERTPTSETTPPSPTSRRRSGLGFRTINNFLHNLAGSGSSSRSSAIVTNEPEITAAVAASSTRSENAAEQRNGSAVTVRTHARTASEDSNTGRPSNVNRHGRHRVTQSGGSTSTLNLPFRTLSRQRSTTTLPSNGSRVNLTSPSVISLNSISAPLSHTLMRTEIRYPRGGPTPEQIRLISSRESLGRFGVPYGRDAIEHAQNSRMELPLEPPPPAFEEDGDERVASPDIGGGDSLELVGTVSLICIDEKKGD